MLKIFVQKMDGVTELPIAGSEYAAGYDIIAMEDPKIVGDMTSDMTDCYNRIDYIQYHTK